MEHCGDSEPGRSDDESAKCSGLHNRHQLHCGGVLPEQRKHKPAAGRALERDFLGAPVRACHHRGASAGSVLYVTSACTAVGFAGSNGLADRWNGTAWKAQAVPKPTGAKSIQLNAVKCTSSTVCTVAGSGTYPASPINVVKTLAERWNGIAWKNQSIPTPSPSSDSGTDVLTGISCTSASACTAVGYYENNQVLEDTLAEAWNGTAWTIQSTPNNNADNSLLGVACTSTTICEAVGESDGDGGFSSGGNLAMQRT